MVPDFESYSKSEQALVCNTMKSGMYPVKQVGHSTEVCFLPLFFIPCSILNSVVCFHSPQLFGVVSSSRAEPSRPVHFQWMIPESVARLRSETVFRASFCHFPPLQTISSLIPESIAVFTLVFNATAQPSQHANEECAYWLFAKHMDQTDLNPDYKQQLQQCKTADAELQYVSFCSNQLQLMSDSAFACRFCIICPANHSMALL